MIYSYPQNVAGSLRKKDTRRKEAIERRKTRTNKKKRNLMNKIAKVQDKKTMEMEESLGFFF